LSIPKFEPLSKEEVAKLQQQSDDVYRNSLTKGVDPRFSEKNALDGYTDGTYNAVNSLLYGVSEESEWRQVLIRNDIKLIDSAMDKWWQEDNITVYRGARAKHYEGWVVGDERTVPAFVSTSVSKREAQRFCKYAEKDGDTPIMVEIYVPKGARGIYIGENSMYPDQKSADFTKEGEFLLGRGSKYRVIERNDNLLRLEVIP